jgi:sporulation protein YlmC with PRC-barrel domain
MASRQWLCAAIVPLLGWTAQANAQDEPKPTPQQTPPQVSKEALKENVPFCHRASEVVGTDVKNLKKEDLGEVKELVIDPETGEIEYAVISFGGFLGMGDKLFAVPFELLQAPEVKAGDDLAHFTFDADKASLENAPGFEMSKWPNINDPSWCQEIDRFYGNRTSLDPDDDRQDEHAKDPMRAIDPQAENCLFRSSKLIGMNVHNPQDEDLGEIKEIVLDPGHDRISYFVLKSGGMLGMGGKLFAIPWEVIQVTPDGDEQRLTLNMTKERFEKAPEYQESDWNRMSDPDWVEEVYIYYGTRPYWSVARVEPASSQR